jgi:HSP20 family protein
MERGPLALLPTEFGALFNRAFGWPMPFEPFWEEAEGWGLEMEELEKEVVIRAEVPGFEPGELEVELLGNVLTVRAEHPEPPEGKVPAGHRYGRLVRTMTLPPGIVPEGVEARYHHGILEVHVPRAPEAVPRRIEVKV